MRRIEKYYCELCGENFDTEEECREHERTHYTNWEEVDNSKIAEYLRNLSDSVFDYRANGTVLGYFVSDLSALMDEAEKRLGEKDK